MPAESIDEQVVKYLTDLHSTEVNALAQLKTGADSAEEPQLAAAFKDHLVETEEQERMISERLEALDAKPSKVKDLAQKGGAMATGALAKTTPDTTGKLAIQAYAFEHLEIASYRMLRVVAETAGDHETVKLAEHILGQEEAAAEKLDGLLEGVAKYDLEQRGLTASGQPA